MSTRQLVTGLAALLETAGIGQWTFGPGDVYEADTVAITISHMPDQPDNVITLTASPMADQFDQSHSTATLQVRTRAAGQDPLDVGDLSDAVFDALQGLWSHTLSTGTQVVSVQRRGGGPLGQDQQGRWARSDNYAIEYHQPSTHRT